VRKAEAKSGRDDVVFFPNWVDTDFITPLEGSNPYRAELGLKADEVIALYSGNMGKKQGIDLVVQAARQLAAGERPIRFVLCGRGVEYEDLKRSTADLPNVIWLPLQPYERLNDLLNLADIHLLPQKATAADLVMPSKLPSMLASGRAVLATAETGTEVARTVEGCGLVVAPGSVEAFIDGLTALADSPEQRRAFGLQARSRAVALFSREEILKRIEGVMRGEGT
jgi:colanic acid biosynthesis glycosyl transferase WcaI